MTKATDLLKLIEGEDFTDSTGFPTDDMVKEAAEELGITIKGEDLEKLSAYVKDKELTDKKDIEKAIKFFFGIDQENNTEKSERKINENETYDNFRGFLEKEVPGYGGPGPEDMEQYFTTIDNILQYIADDMVGVLQNDNRNFDSKDINNAKHILGSKVSFYRTGSASFFKKY